MGAWAHGQTTVSLSDWSPPPATVTPVWEQVPVAHLLKTLTDQAQV